MFARDGSTCCQLHLQHDVDLRRWDSEGPRAYDIDGSREEPVQPHATAQVDRPQASPATQAPTLFVPMPHGQSKSLLRSTPALMFMQSQAETSLMECL